MMALDLTKISFYSNLNYIKRTEFVGNSILSLGAGLEVSTKVITHNLGYVPFFIVGANINNNTIIWSNDRIDEYTRAVGSFADPLPSLSYWCTDTELTINIRNGDGTGLQTGTRAIYWAIYLDQE